MIHTPGPWGHPEGYPCRVTDDIDGNDDPIGGTLAEAFNPYEAFRCDAPDIWESGEEIAEGNARLIAAAPDLLNALKLFVQWYAEFAFDDGFEPDCRLLNYICETIKKAGG